MTDFTLIIGNKNYSSWSLRGWLALKAAGLAFDEILLQLDTDDFYSRIIDYNPSGTVPALMKEDQLLAWDSLAIIDTVDAIAPDAGLWPRRRDGSTDSYALAKSMSAEMHSGLMAIRSHLPMNMRAQYTGKGFSEAVLKDISRVESLWTQALTDHSDGGPYLFGDRLSGADCMFAPVVSRFRTYGVILNEQCEKYRLALENHPAYQEWTAAALAETVIVTADEIDQSLKVLG